MGISTLTSGCVRLYRSRTVAGTSCCFAVMTSAHTSQIQDPSGRQQAHTQASSSGDHSFDAQMDGKFVYCFSNEHWSSNSKEVSFNVHGIVYVPESEAPSDPLEQEGTCRIFSYNWLSARTLCPVKRKKAYSAMPYPVLPFLRFDNGFRPRRQC